MQFSVLTNAQRLAKQEADRKDKQEEEDKGPWSFSEDRLHYVVDFIFKFLIGIRYNK